MNYFVSVIICTYNRCRDLKNVLDSLLRQEDDYLIYEIIIADNNSSDWTKEVLLEYAPKFSGKLKYILERRQGKSYTANRAIGMAKGNVICMTDDDVILHDQWVSNIVKCFDAHNCDGVGGRVLPVFPKKTAQWVKDYASKLSGSVVIYDHGDKICEFKGDAFPFIGANLAFKREVFQEAGFFRTDLGVGTNTVGEDTEFIERVLSRGKTLFYCGKAVVWHPFDPKRLTLKHMALWNISLGKYACRMEAEKKTSMICYFGIPRYLFRGIVQDFMWLFGLCWSKPKFFIAWRNLFRKVGMLQEYYEFSRKGNKACLKSV
jgi:glycosyltransferase involved in cell wall biosynthesis